MYKLNLYCLIFLLSFLTIGCAKNEQQIIINQVIDGDTFTYKNKTIRLFGVDTPEITIGFPSFEATTGLEALYARQAKKYVTTLIMNKTVTFIYLEKDKYQRQVGKVIYQEEDLGLTLINNGLARVAYISDDPSNWYYSDDFNYYRKLLEAQYFAYINEIGLWKDKASFKVIFPKAS